MNFKKLKLVTLCGLLAQTGAFASTSLMVGGHAGLVSQYSTNMPPTGSNYFAFRVPIGLTLQASPTDNLNVYLGLDYAYNNYPDPPILLGQTSSTSTANSNGQSTPMPFANTVGAQNGSTGTPYGQKTDTPTLTTAYFTYQTPIGLLRAGRMLHNWGLGIWNNAKWSPTGGPLSTTDAVALSTDLNLFDATVYMERFGEGVGGTSSDGTASAYTAEVRLKTDPADTPSSGVSREIGVAYSLFNHGQSSTSLNIMDMYGKFYSGPIFIGGEVLYPSGKTQNPNYQALGGAAECSTVTGRSSDSTNKTCGSENISALAALLQFKWLINGPENSSQAATDVSREYLASSQRPTTHELGAWIGYASGGANQFDPTGIPSSTTPRGSSDISAIMMNSNIQPSFLMFNNTNPAINGMPTGAITNTTFACLSYTYESPELGSLGPVFVWGRLNRTNQNFNANNSLCTSSATVNSSVAINHLCVGGSANLGAEVDLSYRYTTEDHVHVGADLGYWFVGNAWQVYGQGNPGSVYGFRIYTGTEF